MIVRNSLNAFQKIPSIFYSFKWFARFYMQQSMLIAFFCEQLYKLLHGALYNSSDFLPLQTKIPLKSSVVLWIFL